MVGFSTAQPNLFKRNTLEPISDLKLLIKDYTPIAKNALTMLINVSDDPEVVQTCIDDDVFLDEHADLVVCDLVSPSDDLPVEVAIAATRGVEVMVLAPEGVEIDGMAADMLGLCDVTVIRYDGVEPHRALHARLLN